MEFQISKKQGKPYPLGASQNNSGWNFALFSKNAEKIFILFYLQGEKHPFAEIALDPLRNRTGNTWHILISELPENFSYLFRIEGPWEPEKGLLFHPGRQLLDPYGKGLEGFENWGIRTPQVSTPRSLPCCISEFDWKEDTKPNRPFEESIIYELHVRGFTQHENSAITHRGTYAGLTETIPYLTELGITAVELLPIFEFDETDCPFTNPETGERLLNYWGYNPLSFFAPKSAYAVDGANGNAIREFKEMVRTFHQAGIEVILDVVFNHTGEGSEKTNAACFKGIENNVYYILDLQANYCNFTGCGNTVNTNHPVVQDLILDALRYWVVEMHVDGFRFDLGSIFCRGKDGKVLENPPILERIADEPILAATKLIVEPWDAVGLYQVGSFPAYGRWGEWNAHYKNTVRGFVKGETGLTGELAKVMSGSRDIYPLSEENSFHSINYVTSHDGFTLNDLVSYNNKHNTTNGENNRDGENHNLSFNHGVEGETDDPAIQALRLKQLRNFATLLLLSHGTPMIVAGDEFGRTQKGNNNPWCQDNSLSWIDWKAAKNNSDLAAFWKRLIRFRKRHRVFTKQLFTGKDLLGRGIADLSWHGTKAGHPDFSYFSRSLAFLMDGAINEQQTEDTIYVAMNFWSEPLTFELPHLSTKSHWRLLLDTHCPWPFAVGLETVINKPIRRIKLNPFSIKVLLIKY